MSSFVEYRTPGLQFSLTNMFNKIENVQAPFCDRSMCQRNPRLYISICYKIGLVKFRNNFGKIPIFLFRNFFKIPKLSFRNYSEKIPNYLFPKLKIPEFYGIPEFLGNFYQPHLFA